MTARTFVLNIVLKLGAPAQILTDQGPNFLSNLFRSICKLLWIKKIQTTAFHPASKGGLERSHRVLAKYLRLMVGTYIAAPRPTRESAECWASYVERIAQC